MDVEGFEVEIFQGMNNLIESKKPLRIMVEFHSDKYSEERDFTKELIKLKEKGFKIKNLVTQDKPYLELMKSKGYKPIKVINDSPNTRALYGEVDIEDLCYLIKKGNIIRAGFFERK